MKKWSIVVALAFVFLVAVLVTESRWEGDVTEAAATPLADKAGVEESRVLPWKIDGDLLLFFFLSGGAIAGFAAGYHWRSLFSKEERQGVDGGTAAGAGRDGNGGSAA